MQNRQLEILRAIVEEYVATDEPVGSKAISKRHGLGVSPATIRNDMAQLEEAGLITQPHTSAGRIPTNKGYRVFVDKLASIKPLSNSERKAIEIFMEGAHDLDDLLTRTVKLLSQLTGQISLVQYPILSGSIVRHIDLVSINEKRIIVIIAVNESTNKSPTVKMINKEVSEHIVTVIPITPMVILSTPLVTA